jgi:hypothetical protein
VPENLYTWNLLATVAGASTLSFLIVCQLKKYLGRWVPSDLLAVGVAWGVLVSATAFTTGLTPERTLLCFFNAWVVAEVAGRMYDRAQTETQTKLQQGGKDC